MTQKQRKPLQQRLQSRISIRRNVIRYLEREIAAHRAYTSITGDKSGNELARQLREQVNLLAIDQRTDKDLFALVLDVSHHEREVQLFMDAVAEEQRKGLFGIDWESMGFFGAHAHG